MSKIDVKNLTKIFGQHPEDAIKRLKQGKDKNQIFEETGMTVGVNRVSFRVEEGEIFVIMGLSGSGKSTLIRLINRLIEPASGEVYIDGENIVEMDKHQLMMTRRQKLGMVFQNFALFPHRTILDNVAYGLEVQGVSKEEREKIKCYFFPVLTGVPLGILAAKSDKADKVIRPILDFMQTLPSFVYLIPTILLFGVGGVSAVIATFVFATPPAVRLTNLGIRQVPTEVVEAGKAFGSTSWQMLVKVQLPIAMPTIMAGINKTIMLALFMAVISAMIGAPGLGSAVLAGISQVDVGKGLVAGLGIVVLAIVLDRITEGLSQKQRV